MSLYRRHSLINHVPLPALTCDLCRIELMRNCRAGVNQGCGKVVDGGWRQRLRQAAPRYTAQKDGPLLGANGLVVLVKPKNPCEPRSRLLLAAYRGSVRDFAGTLASMACRLSRDSDT